MLLRNVEILSRQNLAGVNSDERFHGRDGRCCTGHWRRNGYIKRRSGNARSACRLVYGYSCRPTSRPTCGRCEYSSPSSGASPKQPWLRQRADGPLVPLVHLWRQPYGRPPLAPPAGCVHTRFRAPATSHRMHSDDSLQSLIYQQANYSAYLRNETSNFTLVRAARRP